MIVDHVHDSPDTSVDDVRAFLRQRTASRVDDGKDSVMTLCLIDIKAARNRFVDDTGNVRGMASRPSFQRSEIGGDREQDDDSDESEPSSKTLDAPSQPEKPAAVKQLASAGAKRLPRGFSPINLTFHSKSTTDGPSTNQSTITPASGRGKRDQPLTPADISQPTKRIRVSDDATPAPPSVATSTVVDEASGQLVPRPVTIELKKAKHVFLTLLGQHIRSLGQQNQDMSSDLNRLDQISQRQSKAHQQGLDLYQAAQDGLAATKKKLVDMQEEKQRLDACQKSLDDAKEAWMRISQDKFEALVQDHRAQVSANAKELADADSQVRAAHVRLAAVEHTVQPAVVAQRGLDAKVQERKALQADIADRKKRLEILGRFVMMGAPGVESLEKKLEAKELSLVDLVETILQEWSASRNSEQAVLEKPPAKPTA
ncbi:hypothetical protein FALBO_16821 [Fusarium albosuccineum]|uniref:Uncharacterized protein n=1 Tax=Fusarium albosuccineum TaxID=1237068 RepID=A0A8H4KBQ8_9HYPO|nr:hypothetical protein FALBO_16821 [Fusarium albosuccineum]